MASLDLPPFRAIRTRDDLPADDTQFLPPGAALLMTPPMRRLLTYGPKVLDRRRVILDDGPAGAGKSTNLAVLAAASPVPVHRLLVMKGTTPKGFLAQLLSCVTGVEYDVEDMSQRKFENRLAAALGTPQILVVDEAQNIPPDILFALRKLLADPLARFGMYMAGTGVIKHIAGEPMLNTWVALRIRHEPLVHDDMPMIQKLHPLLGTLSLAVLTEINQRHCRGSLRSWVVLLENLLDFAEKGTVTPQVINGTIEGIRGRPFQLKAA